MGKEIVTITGPIVCYCPKCGLVFQGYWDREGEGLAKHYAEGCAGEYAERLVQRFEAAVDRMTAALERRA